MNDCVFCRRESLDIIAENDLALAFYDACPVSKGHILVIPKRHVKTYFDASPEEHEAIRAYNIGANVGHDAGQTVFHFHIHIIPRYKGDVEDPRGGVRKVIPTRGNHFQCSKNALH